MEKLNAWQTAAHGLVKKIAVAPEYEGAVEFTAEAVKSGVSWRSVTPRPPASRLRLAWTRAQGLRPHL